MVSGFRCADRQVVLDITPGSVSVLGLMNDRDARVRLLIDRDLLDDAYLCCEPVRVLGPAVIYGLVNKHGVTP